MPGVPRRWTAGAEQAGKTRPNYAAAAETLLRARRRRGHYPADRRQADIGTGTLFLYAKTKGELLLLVQNAGYADALLRGQTGAEARPTPRRGDGDRPPSGGMQPDPDRQRPNIPARDRLRRRRRTPAPGRPSSSLRRLRTRSQPCSDVTDSPQRARRRHWHTSSARSCFSPWPRVPTSPPTPTPSWTTFGTRSVPCCNAQSADGRGRRPHPVASDSAVVGCGVRLRLDGGCSRTGPTRPDRWAPRRPGSHRVRPAAVAHRGQRRWRVR